MSWNSNFIRINIEKEIETTMLLSFLVNNFQYFPPDKWTYKLDSSLSPISIHVCTFKVGDISGSGKKMEERKGYEEGDRENVSNWMNIHVHPFFHLRTSVLKAGYKRISLFRESSNNIEEVKKKEGRKGRGGDMENRFETEWISIHVHLLFNGFNRRIRRRRRRWYEDFKAGRHSV